MTRTYCLSPGAVVGALAHRAAGVSRGVFNPDCGDVQVLQSPGGSLPNHG